MKIITLSIAMLMLSVMAFSQNCIGVTSAFFSNPSNDGITWSLTINWQANGQKHINVVVASGTPGNTVTLLNTCFTVHAGGGSTGTEIFDNIIAPGGISTLYGSLEGATGNCGGGNNCSLTLINPPGGGPLPIIISSFYAKRNGNVVSLNWTSGTEINAKEFVIERNPGTGFVPVGTVAAANNGMGSSYTYADNNLLKTVSQYRLKLIDADARFKYSEIKAVKGTGAVSDFTIYPNPSIGTSKVTITDIAEATTVQLIDNAGRIVKTTELKNSNSIELNDLKKGVYLVRITNNNTGDAVTKKLTVIN